MKSAADVMTDELVPGGDEGGASTRTSKPAKPTTTSRIKAPAAKPATGGGNGSRALKAKVTQGQPDVDLVGGVLNGNDSALAPRAVTDDGPLATREDDGEAGDDTDPLARTDGSERSRPRWPARARRSVALHPVTAIVGGIAVALAVALILTLLALGNRNATDSARTSAISAARTDAVKVAGYDYRHLDRDFAAVLADSTPSFRRSFLQASDALKTTLSRYHATAVAKVVSAGLVSATTSRAVVLVFLTQNIINSAQKATSDRSQIKLTLVQSGGRWLIDQVSLL
jgi:Mce-associated membrane protein